MNLLIVVITYIVYGINAVNSMSKKGNTNCNEIICGNIK